VEVCAAGRWVQFQWMGLSGWFVDSLPALLRLFGGLLVLIHYHPFLSSLPLSFLPCMHSHTLCMPTPTPHTYTLTQMMMYLTTNFLLKTWLGNVQHLTSCVRLWSPTNSDLPSPHPGETTRYTTKSPFLGNHNVAQVVLLASASASLVYHVTATLRSSKCEGREHHWSSPTLPSVPPPSLANMHTLKILMYHY